MAKRLIALFILCLVLGAIGAAFGQDTVKLELKFTPGELLRYKIVGGMNLDMQINMQNAPQMPTVPIQIVGITRQRTKKVLPNGDAEIATAVETLKVIMGSETKELPGNQIPVITMVISKNGVVKSIQGLEKFNNSCGNIPFTNLGNLGQYSGLPLTPLRVGESWTQNVPFPMGGGNMRVVGTLLSANAALGPYTVAVLKQDVGGDINLAMALPDSTAKGAANVSGAVNANGKVNGTSNVYFSAAKGQVIRTEGAFNMQINMAFAGAASDQQGTMTMNMRMNFEQFLLQ